MFAGQVEFEPAASPETLDSEILNCCITEHLKLRPLKLSDTHALFALTEANRNYLRQWLPWLDDNQKADDTRQFIQTSLEKAQTRDEYVSAICCDQKIVGMIGLHDISWPNRSGGIGYWLAKSQQGEGMMTRACQSMMDYGFTTLNLNRIDICCAAKNSRSEAVAKRLGLTYEGLLRDAEWLYDHFVDHKVYSMLRREWQTQFFTEETPPTPPA